MVFEKVKEIIAAQMSTPEEEITLETNFMDDLGADSLDLFQIISDLEDCFSIEFQNEDAEKIKTVGDAVNYINAAK